MDNIELFVLGKTRTGHFHPNGGGFVESTATVPTSSFVGPMCKVLDTAQVLDSTLKGQVIVANNAIVSGLSQISDHSAIINNAQVIGGLISGYVVVKDNAIVSGDTLTGNAIIRSNVNSNHKNLDYFSSDPCDTKCNTSNNDV